MRPSPKLHVVALLRLQLGMTQGQFAKKVGCSRETIQSVELLRFKRGISEKLAGAISSFTGVSMSWLEANDLTAPPVTIGDDVFTVSGFERYRERQERTFDEYTLGVSHDLLLGSYVQLRAIFAKAGRKGEATWNQAFSLLKDNIKDLRKRFGEVNAISKKNGQDGVTRMGSFPESYLTFVEHEVQAARARLENNLYLYKLAPRPTAESMATYLNARNDLELPPEKITQAVGKGTAAKKK